MSFLNRKPHARISSITLNPYSPNPSADDGSFSQQQQHQSSYGPSGYSNASFDNHAYNSTSTSSGNSLALSTTVSHHASYFLAGCFQFLSIFSDRTLDVLATDRKVRETCLRSAVLQVVVLVSILVAKAFGLGTWYYATVVGPLLLGTTYLGSTAGSNPPSLSTVLLRGAVGADWFLTTFTFSYLARQSLTLWLLVQPIIFIYTDLTNAFFIFDASWVQKHMSPSAQLTTLRTHHTYFLGLALPLTIFLAVLSFIPVPLLPLLFFTASIPLLQTISSTARPLPISPDYPSAWGMGASAGTGLKAGDSISLMRSEGAYEDDASSAGGAGLLPGHPAFPKSMPVLYLAQFASTFLIATLGLGSDERRRGAKKHAGGGFHDQTYGQANGYSYGQSQMNGYGGAYGGQNYAYNGPVHQSQPQVLFDYSQQSQVPPPPPTNMTRSGSGDFQPAMTSEKVYPPPPPQIRLQQPSISGGVPPPPMMGKKKAD